ncbi:hypothetical protein OEZ85_014442 [Tetradesmus obliquus]|uniref:Uncharacterized protein n=1 Tax=Tetradesmus obliquus TaxID=3088 RepID=A0ABY8U8N8_TETOB|nr:hypothetical protein OEZ85_014442 [Tetradesmus obliquus]
MARAVALCLACLAAVLGIAAAQSYGNGVMDCSSIPGCAQCVPFAFNIREAAAKFSAEKQAKVQARQARAAAKAAKAGTAAASGAAGTAAPAARGLLTADETEAIDVAESGIGAADAKGMAVAPSCVACQAGYSMVTRSVRGRPPMGRCECAAGFGRQESTFTRVTARGATRLAKTFTCAACGPNQVPLTPASGLRITNAGVVLVQEPIVAAAGQKVPRNKFLPAPAAKRFNLVPGQCVECPAGSVRTADGIACEAT